MANNWSSVADGLVLLEECAIVTHLPARESGVLCVWFDDTVHVRGGEDGGDLMDCEFEDGLRHALPVGERVPRELFPQASA